MAASPPPGAVVAARRWAPLVAPIAKRYTNPVTGKKLDPVELLLKLSSGENHFSFSGVSSAGARGPVQFIPGTRQAVMSKYGLDPWKNYDQAFHAAALHLIGKVNGSTGLEGYNPGGGQSYVNYILGQRLGAFGQGGAGKGAASPAPAGGAGAVATSPVTPSAAAGTGTEELLATLLNQRPAIQSSAPALPAAFAGPQLPQSFQAPMSSSAPQPKVDVASLLTALRPQNADAPQAQAPAAAAPSSAAPAPSRGSGTVVIAAGANRPGVGLQKPILTFLDQLAGASGRTVNVGTGTRHNQYVKGSSNVSDHWAGNAADLPQPVDSRQGDLVAAHAIALAGRIPFAKALEMARGGGVWNFQTKLGRVQILWRTMVGGNHHNHVHIGVNPGR